MNTSVNTTNDIKFRKQGLEHKYGSMNKYSIISIKQEIQGRADYKQD